MTAIVHKNPLHKPVLVKEVLEFLNVREGKLVWVDATTGGGGHLSEIIKLAGPSSTVVGIDRDSTALAVTTKRLATNPNTAAKLIPVHSNFTELPIALQKAGVSVVTGGIVADLGVSSLQLDDPDRGFSFTHDGPLDMRMDISSTSTASDLVNNLNEEELSNIIRNYGEERHHRAIAKSIVHNRPVTSTGQLAKIVADCVERVSRKRAHARTHYRIHPATRTFQALRIAVNDELNSLKIFLRSAIDVLAPRARLAVISFHSLEDRIVKQMFKEAAASCICPPRQPVCTCGKQPQLLIITRKPVIPTADEKLANPRSRSAKLRVVEKLD